MIREEMDADSEGAPGFVPMCGAALQWSPSANCRAVCSLPLDANTLPFCLGGTSWLKWSWSERSRVLVKAGPLGKCTNRPLVSPLSVETGEIQSRASTTSLRVMVRGGIALAICRALSIASDSEDSVAH